MGDRFHPPGDSDLGEALHAPEVLRTAVAGRLGSEDDVERPVGRTVPLDEMDQIGDRGGLIGRRHREEQRVYTVESGGPPEGGSVVRPLAADPDRDAFLPRRREQLGTVHRMVLAREVERLPGPQALQHSQALVQLSRPHLGIDILAEVAELESGRTTEPDAEREPTAGQVIERGHLAGHLPRAAPGQRQHHRANPNPRGFRRDERQRHRRVDRRLTRLPVVLTAPLQVVPDPKAVPAGSFRLHRELREEFRVGIFAEDRNVDTEPHAASTRRRGHRSIKGLRQGSRRRTVGVPRSAGVPGRR